MWAVGSDRNSSVKWMQASTLPDEKKVKRQFNASLQALRIMLVIGSSVLSEVCSNNVFLVDFFGNSIFSASFSATLIS